jgi:uncharacterized protein (TIGR02266 family)
MPVKFRVAEVDMDYKMAELEDISWAGVFIRWPKPFVKSTRLIMQFFLAEDSVVLEVWGTVVRVREARQEKPAGMGVQFDELDDAARSTIQKMVEAYLKPYLKKS